MSSHSRTMRRQIWPHLMYEDKEERMKELKRHKRRNKQAKKKHNRLRAQITKATKRKEIQKKLIRKRHSDRQLAKGIQRCMHP